MVNFETISYSMNESCDIILKSSKIDILCVINEWFFVQSKADLENSKYRKYWKVSPLTVVQIG